jgi:glyoxylase I family protein
MSELKFSHVALNCREPHVIESFYTRHFGFERARVIPLGTDEIVFLRCGDVYLELFRAVGDPALPAPVKDGPVGPGCRHIAFQVDDVDAKLADMGEDARVTLGPLSFDDVIPGWRTAWIADPEGNIVEISQGYRDQIDPPVLKERLPIVAMA